MPNKGQMTDDQLRDEVFTALALGPAALTELCRARAEEMTRAFPEWQKVPPALRNDPEDVQAWGRCLITIAQQLERQGRPEAMARLADGIHRTFDRWRSAFDTGRRLSEAGRTAQAHAVLTGVLSELETSSGNAVDELRRKVLGLLGSNALAAGDEGAAEQWTRLALSECEAAGDVDGVRTYRQNLQLLQALSLVRTAGPAGNRVVRIRRMIDRAQKDADTGWYERSSRILQQVLEDLGHPQGDASDAVIEAYRAKVLGQLGWNAAVQGHFSAARPLTAQALEQARRTEDLDGERIYGANLSEIEAHAGTTPPPRREAMAPRREAMAERVRAAGDALRRRWDRRRG